MEITMKVTRPVEVKAWKHVPSGRIFYIRKEYDKYTEEYEKLERERKASRKRILNLKKKYREQLKELKPKLEDLKEDYKDHLVRRQAFVSKKTNPTVRQIDKSKTLIMKHQEVIKICSASLKNQIKDYTTEFSTRVEPFDKKKMDKLKAKVRDMNDVVRYW